MKMVTIQKVVRVGSSKGVTLPAKQLRQLGVDIGDEVKVSIDLPSGKNDKTAIETATSLLDRYDEDFKNLANR